jgi:hypothetical protein
MWEPRVQGGEKREGRMSTPSGRSNPLACFDRGFMWRTLGAAGALVLLAVLGRWLALERGSAPRIALGLAQVAVMGYAIAITVGAIRRLDEMQQRIQLEGIAFAFAASAIAMTGWGFMAKAGLPAMSWGPETWLLMVLFWALGLWLARRRYR